MIRAKEMFGSDAVGLRETSAGVFKADNGTTQTQVSLKTEADAIQTALDAAKMVACAPTKAYDGTTGHKAIDKASGCAMLTKATAGTDYTLAAPTATTDDGIEIEIITTTAAAHVVTAGAGKINGATNGTATFAAAIGNNVKLKAYQGVWYTVGTPLGVTIA